MMMMMIMMLRIDLPGFTFIESCSCFRLWSKFLCIVDHRCSVPRSNNSCVDTIFRVILFQTSSSFVPSYLPVVPCHKFHPATRLYCPPQSKNVVFIPKLTLFTDFCPFFRPWNSQISTDSWNGCQARIALGQLYIIATQSLLRDKLRCIKILIETILDDKWFACVNIGCFRSKLNLDFMRCSCSSSWTIWHHARRSGPRKLAKLENWIFRSARDRFSKTSFLKSL